MYGCLPCSFFVHKSCIYLPKVIKLTRHSHRMFHTFQVLDKKKCRICYQPLLYEYGVEDIFVPTSRVVIRYIHTLQRIKRFGMAKMLNKNLKKLVVL